MNNNNKEVAVSCKNISFGYETNRKVINGISLKIYNKEKIGIIGPNGAGKSTFLKLLNGVLIGSGELKIYGIPVTKKYSSQTKKIVGLVFQNPDDQLFCPTIFEDVAFGPFNMGLSQQDISIQVTKALYEVGLSGYENKSTFNLSFGERKLVAISTIISMSPQIIAMDEPTSNLDSKHRRKIINWLKRSNNTTIVTSHDLDMLLETCDRILIFNKGILVLDDKVDIILKNKTLLEENDLELPLSLQLNPTI